MLQTVRAEKVDEKNGVICLASIFSSRVMVIKLSKKCISAANLGLLKQFTYMHLKGLVTHFQKMVLFIVLSLTISEILVFEVKGFC